jgi:hypothetical protein
MNWRGCGKKLTIVCVVTRLQAGGSEVLTPAKARDFSVFQNIQTGLGTHLTSYSMGTGILSPRYGGLCVSMANHLHLVLRFKYE